MPSQQELTRQIIAAKSEKWLQEKIKEHENVFGSTIEDPGLKLWMIAKANGIEVADIKADSGGSQEGTPLQLVEFTDKLALEETEKSQRKESGLYSVEGLVTSDLEQGTTRKGGDKVSFFLQDPTGRAKIVAYNEDAISALAQARIKQGKFIRLPLVGMLAGPMPDNAKKTWKQLTIPPFGRVEVVEGKDFREVYKDPTKDAIENEDAIFLQGVITVLDPDPKDACSACKRWVSDDGEKNAKAHSKCGNYEIIEQVNYRGTIALGNASTYAFNIGNWLTKAGAPEFPIATGITRLFGIWNSEYKNLKVQGWEVVTSPGQKVGAATPVRASPAPAKTSPRPSPKPAPAPIAEPAEEQEGETGEEMEAVESAVDGPGTFNASILATVPEGIPRPSNPAELAALATDFRGLQGLAKHLGINARQKVPKLIEEIAAKLSVAAETPAVKEANKLAKKDPKLAGAAAVFADDAKKFAAKTAPAAAPAGKDQMTVIKEAIFGVLREMGPLSEEDLREGVKMTVESQFDMGKFNFALKLAKNSGRIADGANGLEIAVDETPEPVVEEAVEEEAPAPAPPKTAPKQPASKFRIEESDGARAQPAKTSPAKPTPAASGEIPEAVSKHFESFIRDFGGKNRTIVVVNNAIAEPDVVAALGVSEAEVKQYGDKDEAVRQKMYGFLEAAVAKGALEWDGQWTEADGSRKPPKAIKWVGDDA